VNLATKAPNFTRENAAEMARRSNASRIARIEREKQERLARENLILAAGRAMASLPTGDEARRAKVLKQIDSLISDMEKSESIEERIKIGKAVEGLWKLVQPTAGVLKPGKDRVTRRGGVAVPLSAAPQAPAPDTTTPA
jgi:hypothetical protein